MEEPRNRRAEEEKLVDPRMEHVKRISERVERDDYAVDASAVAEAIVRRLLEGRAGTLAGESGEGSGSHPLG